MANVFLAVQENLGREVALKVLNPSLLKDGQPLQRFKIEAQTAAKLSNPNIVTVYDVGQAGETHYIAMEYLETSLRDRIEAGSKENENRPPIPEDECLLIIEKMAEALCDAHEQNVIHRDIKPDNIMFRPDGNPVLVDFGIARALELKTRLTMTGVNIGTPHYMSPEQCKGESIDGRSDIYSLGIVLYEMLSGKIPYTAEYITGLIYHHTQGPVALLPESRQKFQPLIDAMMTKHKDLRVKDGKQLIQLIKRFRANPEIGFSFDPQFIEPPPKRKNKTPLLILAGLMIGILSYFLFVPGAPEKEDTAHLPAKKVAAQPPIDNDAAPLPPKTNRVKATEPIVKKTSAINKKDSKTKPGKRPEKRSPEKKVVEKTQPEPPAPVVVEEPAVNFVNLRRETISQMNNLLKRIEIMIPGKGLIVGGSIQLNLSVTRQGTVTIKRMDVSRLLVNQETQLDMVISMIKEKISGISLEPSKDPQGRPQKVANWRKQFKLGTFKGRMILY